MITELDHNVFAALSQVGQSNPSLLLDIIKTVAKVTQTVVGEDWKKDCDAEGLLAVLVQSLMNAGDSRRAIASKRNGKNHKKKGKCAVKTTQDDLGCTQSVVANTTQDTLAYTLGCAQSTTQSDLACTQSNDKSEAKVCLGCTQNITQDTLGYTLGCTLKTTQDDLACTINHTQCYDKVRQSDDKVCLGTETVDLTAKSAENEQESVAKAQEPTHVQLAASIDNNAEQSDEHTDVCEEAENEDFEREKEEREKNQKRKKKEREYIAYIEDNRGVGEEETRFAVYDNCEDVLQLEQMLNRNGDAQAYYAYLDAKKQREVKQDAPSPQNGKIIKSRKTRAAKHQVDPDIPESFEVVKAYFDEHRAPEAQAFYEYWQAHEWRDKKGPVKSWRGRAATWIRNNSADIPTFEQVLAYCREKKNYVDARQFFAHYNSAGWKVGREYIRNWRSKVDEWACGEKARKRKRDAENAPKYERL